MTPSLAVGFSAAADGREVKIDEDCTLLSAHMAATTATVRGLVSKDPKSTAAGTISAPANSADENIICSPAANEFCFLAFPCKAGSSLFVSATGAGSVIFAFQLNRP